jgi:hypothetical protein
MGTPALQQKLHAEIARKTVTAEKTPTGTPALQQKLRTEIEEKTVTPGTKMFNL